MNKNKHLIMTLAAVALTAVSCVKELPSPDFGRHDSISAVIPITLQCELMEGEEPVKSNYTSSGQDSDLRRITDMQYYLFRSGVLQGQQYFSSPASFAVSIPDRDATYNLYILVNAGEKTIDSSTPESSMSSAVEVEYTDENYVSTMKAKGFPMASVITGFSADSGGQFRVRRLVHELRVVLSDDALTGYNKVTFKSVKVRQAAANVFPFAAASKATRVLSTTFADSQISDEGIESGSRVTLFMLENARGNLLPGVSEWSGKVPSNLSRTERGLATFIEITADADSGTSVYEGNIYRAYLGKSASNFDVMRNEYFVLNNNFTDDLLSDESWRKVIQAPQVREVDLVPTNCHDLIAMYNYPLEARLETDVPYDLLTVTFDVPRVADNCLSTDNKTKYPLAACSYNNSTGVIKVTPIQRVLYGTPWDRQPYYEYIKARVRSTDGLIDRTFQIKYQLSAFSVRWEYDWTESTTSACSGGYLKVVGDRYCRQFMESKLLSIRLTSAGGRITGTTYWNPSGIAGERSQSYVEQVTVSSSPTARLSCSILTAACYDFRANCGQIHHWTFFGTDEGLWRYPQDYQLFLLVRLYLYKGGRLQSEIPCHVGPEEWRTGFPILFSFDKLHCSVSTPHLNYSSSTATRFTHKDEVSGENLEYHYIHPYDRTGASCSNGSYACAAHSGSQINADGVYENPPQYIFRTYAYREDYDNPLITMALNPVNIAPKTGMSPAGYGYLGPSSDIQGSGYLPYFIGVVNEDYSNMVNNGTDISTIDCMDYITYML